MIRWGLCIALVLLSGCAFFKALGLGGSDAVTGNDNSKPPPGTSVPNELLWVLGYALGREGVGFGINTLKAKANKV
jgi:hypothetical protein